MTKNKQGNSMTKWLPWIILGIIFLVFVYFRFYNIDKRIIFDWDQQSYSTDIRNLIMNKDIALIGPRVTDDSGFFLGPYFTYLVAPFYLFTNTHPFALIPFLIMVNIAFFVITFVVLKKIWNIPVALFFLLLWAINPLMIEYDIIPWWPVLLPLGIMGIWFLLWRIYHNPSVQNFVLLGILSGFMTHMHFQFMFINIFTVIFLIVYCIKNKPKLFVRNVLVYFGVVLLSLTPLYLFDIRHDFLNTNLFISYFTERIGGSTPDIHIWRIVFGNFLLPITIKTDPFIVFGFYFLIMGMLFFLLRNKTKFQQTFYISTFFLWIITYIGFSVYGRRPSEYYFVYLYPFIYISIIDLLFHLKKEVMLAGITAILILLNINGLKKATQENVFGLYYKDQAAKTILPYIQNKEYNVSYDMPLGANNGYDYILEVNGIVRSNNPDDPLIQLRIPPHKGDIRVKEIGVYIPDELKK